MIKHQKYDNGIEVYSSSIQGVLVDGEEIESTIHITTEDVIQIHLTESNIVKYLCSKGYRVELV